MPPLLKLILIRVGLGLLTLFLVSVVVFAATQALPGDTARAILGKEAADKARYEALRKQLGLDRPIHEQYIEWLGGVVTGDMGDSLVQDEPVTKLLGRRVVNTFTLVFVAAVLSVPISLLLGSLTALKRDTLFDTSITVGSLSLAALPEFVIGIALILPIYQQLKLFILPAVTLTLAVAPYILRILRASTIEVLESEYVMMARLKGLPERLVLNRHALPNALAPALQVTALNLAWLAGGVVVVEYLFAFPGIGSLLVDSVANRDMPMVQAICLIIAAVYVLANLTADILTILVSPRLRTGLR
ncbi:MAG: Glutathione transport system permease protein GsiC [Actinobacteria bacterium ADurb.BinA094]|nr:MAG: Glutathione transport system permease protein GsiC [Actinobacteria bacterium ADurb.BinA094]